jgi:hypothetical protein
MSEEGAKKYGKNWARLIQKIYEADPLTCPKCQGRMKIITFIENEGLSGGLLQALKTAPGDSDCWYICYKSALFDTSKKLRFDIHMFNLNCPKEGRKFAYSGDMMHAFTQ